jgi:type III secretory pathway component EscV
MELRRPAAAASEDDTAREAVTASIARCGAALGLPAVPAPELAIVDGPERVAVNGVGLDVARPRFDARLHPSLAGRFADAITARPDVLVTPAAAASLWTEWGGAGDPPDGFGDLLARLARHWVRPDRVAGAVADWGSRDPDVIFEDALCAAAGPVRVLVDPHTYEAARNEPWTTGPYNEEDLSVVLYRELGVILGEPRLEADESLPAHHFVVAINDLRTAPAPGVPPGLIFVNDTPDRLKLMKLEGSRAVDPRQSSPGALLADEHAEMLTAAGLTTWDAARYLGLALPVLVQRHAAKLYTRDVLEYLLGTLESQSGPVAAQVAALGGSERLLRVLRLLLDERVPVRDLLRIIDTLHDAPGPLELSPGEVAFAARPYLPAVVGFDGGDASDVRLGEAARRRLALPLGTRPASDNTRTVVVYLIDHHAESRLRDPAPLSNEEHDGLIRVIGDEIGYLPSAARMPAILTREAIRPRLAHAVRAAYPTLAVVAHEHLDPVLNLQAVARISAGAGGLA